MAGWHHQCSGHEFGQTSGDGEGQGAWHATVYGAQRVRHDWMIEQQQEGVGKMGRCLSKSTNFQL